MISAEYEIFKTSFRIKSVDLILFGSITIWGIYQAYYQLVNDTYSKNYTVLIVGLFLLLYFSNETSTYYVIYEDGSITKFKGFFAKEYYFENTEIQKIAIHNSDGWGRSSAMILIRENKKEIHRFEFDQETIEKFKECLLKHYKERFEYHINGVQHIP